MNDNKGNQKERHKRIPVYTKEHYGSPKPNKTRKLIDPLPPLIVVVLVAGVIFQATKPKQAWEQEKESKEWFNAIAYNLCEEQLKEQLRDPRSYERAGEIKVIKDDGMEKSIAWEFRARNGFGGMNAGEGVCLIKKDKKWVAATIK